LSYLYKNTHSRVITSLSDRQSRALGEIGTATRHGSFYSIQLDELSAPEGFSDLES